jgi:hypothetical protein
MRRFKVRLRVQPEGRFMIRRVDMAMTAQEFLAMTVSQSGWAIKGWVAGLVAGDFDLIAVVEDEVIEANVILSTLEPRIKLEIRLAYTHGGYC